MIRATNHATILRLLHEHTQRLLDMPRDELRAKIIRERQEMQDGWLGISDWLLTRRDR